MNSINICLTQEHLERIIKDYKASRDEIGREIHFQAYNHLKTLKQNEWTKEKYIDATKENREWH